MPREKEQYRANLERVIAQFPGKEVIPAKEAAAWVFGELTDPRALYLRKDTPCKKIDGRWYTTAVALAKWLS